MLLTHGETYWNDDELIFWSKGGRLVGDSVPRTGFLARAYAESPTGRLEPISTGLAGTCDQRAPPALAPPST
jgi:hypothetical protein